MFYIKYKENVRGVILRKFNKGTNQNKKMGGEE